MGLEIFPSYYLTIFNINFYNRMELKNCCDPNSSLSLNIKISADLPQFAVHCQTFWILFFVLGEEMNLCQSLRGVEITEAQFSSEILCKNASFQSFSVQIIPSFLDVLE